MALAWCRKGSGKRFGKAAQRISQLNDDYDPSRHESGQLYQQPQPRLVRPSLRTILVAIAPFKSIRRHILGRGKDVNRNETPATTPVAKRDDHYAAVDKGFTPPPGPPPGQDSIIAPGGSVYGEDELRHLIGEIKDYQITHGSLLKLVEYETESSVPTRGIGVSILPTPFPRRCFQEALDLQQAFQELYIRVSSDPEWLYTILEPLMECDDFITALWNVYVRVRDANALQSVVCGVLRSDYMLHQPEGAIEPLLKQVEINTFSAAGACHAERIADMHRRVGAMRGLSPTHIDGHLPENHNTDSIVAVLKQAHEVYISSITNSMSRPKCVLITVQPFNFNIADERPIQYGLWDNSIACFRGEWQMLLEATTLKDDRTLLYRPPIGDTEYEVSVVYYRGGYEAREYREHSIQTRVRLEMSLAINCPDILMHMTTCKSVQEALTRPDVVESFIPPESAVKIRETFMYMQALDDTTNGMEAIKLATDPAKAVEYVLKPNRDGGGHNIYRENIPTFLSKNSKEAWKNYVLMRLIQPPPTKGTLMMPQSLYHGEVISELGIVGTALWRRKKDKDVEILQNEIAGWTFKTKPVDVDEMSVVKGYGCFDCPWLS